MDMMYHITLILKAHLSDSNELSVNLQNFETIVACLEFLTEMIQGPCQENQLALSEGSFLDLAAQILKENDSVRQYRNKNENEGKGKKKSFWKWLGGSKKNVK